MRRGISEPERHFRGAGRRYLRVSERGFNECHKQLAGID